MLSLLYNSYFTLDYLYYYDLTRRQHTDTKRAYSEISGTTGITKNKFYMQTGISNGTLDKKSGVTGDTITKIHAAYSDLNLDWLIAGEGEMLKSSVFSIHSDLKSIRDQYAAIVNIDPDDISEKNIINMESPLEFVPIFSYRESHPCEAICLYQIG